MSAPLAYIALGSNLGDRHGMIESALRSIRELPGATLLTVSRIVETEPVGQPGQGRYLNAAAAVRTSLSPRELLAELLAIEAAHERVRSPETRWGPRTLDLDLLLFGDLVIDEPGLTVPHPRLHERLFVLEPLGSIAPDVIHPVLKRSLRSLLHDLRAADAMPDRPPSSLKEPV